MIARITPRYLRCEYRVDPIGVGVRAPRLSWLLESDARDQTQSAYRVKVATSRDGLAEPDLWDSGRIESDQTAHIVYDGAPLTSELVCWWTVTVWDGDGTESAESAPARWQMGLLDRADWSAAWVGLTTSPIDDPTNDLDMDPVVYLRHDFTLDAPVTRATLYATALGLYQMRINGARVGDAELAPEWTDYRKRALIQAYDVTALLAEGANTIGALLGTGWYAGHVGLLSGQHAWGDARWLLAQCQIEYADGRKITVATGPDWHASTGPILFSDLLMGETYDARREMPGWDRPGFTAAGWQPVEIAPPQPIALMPQPHEPIRVRGALVPQAVTEPTPDVTLFDLGQNMVGWVRLKISGPAGTRIRLRFGEMLNPDGTLYVGNLRTARATDTYILRGDEVEYYEPTFTFHGFRYVEVTGHTEPLGPDAITGLVIYNDMPQTGLFECGHTLINQLWSNIVWGQRGNFISVPTDCPQRDERLGWTGDAQVFARTATFNMDVAAFFTKWLVDLADSQTPEGSFRDIAPIVPGFEFYGAPGWGDAAVIIPWTLYRVYGDTRILDRFYPAMSRWMQYIAEANPDYIRTERVGNNYSDWVSLDENTPGPVTATAYWAFIARLMGDIAAALDKEDDIRRYRALYKKISAAFIERFVDEDGLIDGHTQTVYVLALHMIDLPDTYRRRMVEHLVERIAARDHHLSTGFMGTPYLNFVLNRHGKSDLAYRLLLNEDFPSWLYPIHQGATTIWERWDSWRPDVGFQTTNMNSFNHYAFGAVGEWLFRVAAGIDLQQPGYRAIAICPRVDARLGYVRARYDSINGTIGSAWHIDGDTLIYEIAIPANTTALVYLPVRDSSTVTEGDTPLREAVGIHDIEQIGETTVLTVGSGDYVFRIPYG